MVDKLGRLFEPYVIQILPMLLVAFGDGDASVREATDGASRAIMSQLSGQGQPPRGPHAGCWSRLMWLGMSSGNKSGASHDNATKS